MISCRQMSIMCNIMLCHGEQDYMPACPCCPIRWSWERKIACLPALTARLGGYGRERLHACHYCPIRWSRERKIACLPALTARLGGHGREKKIVVPACPYCPIRLSRERNIACLPVLTARLGGHGRERLPACRHCLIMFKIIRLCATLQRLRATFCAT